MDADVVVVGAGPVGLMLAGELRLCGVTPLVLERLPVPAGDEKARGVGPLAAEALHRRGLGDRIAEHHAAGLAAFARDHGSEKGHFAWIHKIDPAMQDEPDRRYSLIWQPDLERILGEHVEGLGVQVRRGHAVTGLAQDGGGVTAIVSSPEGEQRIRAAYLVGCDGGRSTVRKLAGFAFEGTPPTMIMRRVHGRIDGAGQLPPPGKNERGALFHGPNDVATTEHDTSTFEAAFDYREGPVTAGEMQESVRRVAGVDVVISDITDTMRFADHARQATSYRTGRVLLAGDAAHVHSPNGGQGLNLGLMDAVNLGWKLAATVRGWAPAGLLDSYTAERHPVGAAVLHNTRAQSALLRPGPHVDAMRDIVADLMDITEVNRYFGRMMSGLATRYPVPDAAHPLAGRHIPNVKLTLDSGPARLADLTTAGRTLLLSPAPELADVAAGWADRVDIVGVTSIDHDDLSAVLVRPDGAIAWAAAPGVPADTAALLHALRRWLGEPH